MIPSKDERTEIAAPVTFLMHRLKLAQMRQAAQEVSVSNEMRGKLDEMLAETEEVTRMLLLRQPLPDGDFIDDVFDDEFLALCLDMNVDLLSWINQPHMLLRLEHPDAILLRFANVAAAVGHDDNAINSSTAFSEQVTEMESVINATFEILKRNRVI